jgi:hypothetical protein
MSRQYWEELISWAVGSGSPVASTTTETILYPNVTIPANYMADGRTIHIVYLGQYSENSSGTVTKIFTVRWGGVAGTVICKTGTITTLVSAAAWLAMFEVWITVRTNGSSGTVMGNGYSIVFGGTAPTLASTTGLSGIAAMTAGGQITPATASLDLTADTALSITTTHGSTSASDTETGLQYTIESWN